jgi:hypothetical protein
MMGYGYGSGDQRVNAVVDMINGGGQGRAGQQFEGGGLLSMLGNAFAQPYGAEARGAQAPASSMQPMARPASFATAMPIQSTMPDSSRLCLCKLLILIRNLTWSGFLLA